MCMSNCKVVYIYILDMQKKKSHDVNKYVVCIDANQLYCIRISNKGHINKHTVNMLVVSNFDRCVRALDDKQPASACTFGH